MARIESTIGQSNFQERTEGGQRFWTVGDESPQSPQEPVQQQRREISPTEAANLRQAAQNRAQVAENRVFQEAQKRIEILTGLGRKTRDVEIELDDGVITFTLRTLKGFENKILLQLAESKDRVKLPNGRFGFTPTGLYDIKSETVALSLFLIDNQDVDIVLGTVNTDFENKLDARRYLVGEMDNTLTEHLYLQYEILSKETQDGYVPKTAEEAKEVVETIRKSGAES